ncbi:MAG: hypothetical protein KKA35_13235 [Proteobacteria bacterium]|nr:hypothetical protein [Pseudomonadota bacterium]
MAGLPSGTGFPPAGLRGLARPHSRSDPVSLFPLPEWINVSHGSTLGASFPLLLDPDWVIDNDNCGEITASIDPYEKMIHHIGAVEKWLNNHNQ